MSCCGSRYGNGRTNKPLTKLSTAVVAPIASAMVRTAIAVNAGCFSSCRNANLRSLIMTLSLFVQRLNWIDASRTPRGQKTCSQRSDHDHHERGPKRQRIVWTDFVEQIAHQTCQNQGGDTAENDSCRGQLQTS